MWNATIAFLKNVRKECVAVPSGSNTRAALQRIINSGECMQRKIVAFIYDHLSKLYKNHTLVLAFKHNEIHGQCQSNVSKTALQLLEPWRTIPENYFNQMEITDCSNHEQTSRYTLPVFINILIPAYMIVFDVIGIEHKT